MIDPSAWLQGYLEVGRQGAGLFILWWAVGGGLVLLLAETTYQFVSTRNVAFQSYIWRSAALAVFLLPLSLLFSPVQMHLPISSETVLGETSPIQTPPLVRTQTTSPAQESIDNSPMEASLPEKTREESEPMLAAQNGGGEDRPILAASHSNSMSNGHDPFWMAAWIVYGLGVFVGLVFCLWSYLRIRLFLRSTETCAQPSIRQVVEEVSQEMGMQTSIEIRRCESHASPAMLGGWKPNLILPGVLLDEWEVQDVKPILYHELCHLAQWDHFYDQIQRFLRIVLWFFPGVYWLGKRLEEAREKFCDAQAMNRCGDADCYANLIIRLAEDMSSLTPQPTFPMARNGKHALRRFQWILSHKEKLVMINKPLNRWITGMLLAFVIVVIGGIQFSDTFSADRSSAAASSSDDASTMTLRLLSKSGEYTQSVISPNGKYESIIDNGAGNLMLREVETGQIRKLTQNGSYSIPQFYTASSPVFSPDDMNLAYAWFDGNKKRIELRVIDIMGKADHVLVSEEEIQLIAPMDWSRDEKQILAWAHKKDGSALLSVHVEDGSMRTIQSMGDGVSMAAYFSPDGKYIAFDHAPSQDSMNWDVSLIRSEGGEEIPVVKNHGKDILLGWSPDGVWIVYASDIAGTMDVYAIPVLDGEVKPSSSQLLKKEIGHIQPKGIDQNGAFHYETHYSDAAVYTAEFDAKTGEFISEPKAVIQSSIRSEVSWSPDGRYLAFYKIISDESCQLCLWSESTGEFRNIPLPQGDFVYLEWAPDSQSILALQRSGKTGLYSININTGEAKKLLESGAIGQDEKWIDRGHWLADGKSILFTRTEVPGGLDWSKMKSRFAVYNIEDETERDVLHDDIISWRYVLSPDRKWLAYNVLDLQNNDYGSLNIIPVSGGVPKLILEKLPRGNGVLSWTPDGKALFYVEGNNLMCVDAQEEKGAPRKLCSVDRIPSAWSFHPNDGKVAFACEGKTQYETWVLENFLPKESPRKIDWRAQTHQAFLDAEANQSPEQSLRISDVLIEDDFNDGDLDGWVIYEQKDQGPPFEHFVTNGELRLTNAGVNIGRSDWENYSIRFRFCPKTIVDHWSGISLSYRRSNKSHYGFCCFTLNGVIQTITGFHNPEGKFIVGVLNTNRDLNFEVDTWYELKADVIGSSMKGYIDGQLVFDVSNSQYTHGHIHIRAIDTAHIDDISIRLLE